MRAAPPARVGRRPGLSPGGSAGCSSCESRERHRSRRPKRCSSINFACSSSCDRVWQNQKRDFRSLFVQKVVRVLSIATTVESRHTVSHTAAIQLSEVAAAAIIAGACASTRQMVASGLTLGADSKASRGPRFTPFDLPDSWHSRHTGRRRGRLALAGLGDPKALTDVG